MLPPQGVFSSVLRVCLMKLRELHVLPTAAVPSLSTHFSCLQSLRLQDCLLPAGFLPVIMPPLKGQLVSLTLWDVGGTQEAELQQLSALTALTVLRLQPNDHALDGLEMLLPLRQLKNLKVK